MHKFCKFSIFLTFFLDNFGTFLIYPIFTPLFLDDSNPFFQNTPAFVHNSVSLGLLISIFPLAQFFGAPMIGLLSDLKGRKKCFQFTISGLCLAYFLTGLSLILNSLLLLFLGRMLTGLFAGNQSICLASLVDISPSETERTKNFSKIATVGGFASISSISISGIFINPAYGKYFGSYAPFFLISVLFLLNLILISLFFQDHINTQKIKKMNFFVGIHNIKETLKIKGLRKAYLVFFLFMMSWITSAQFLPTLLLTNFNANPGSITLSFLLMGGMWTVSNYIFSKFFFYIPPCKTLKITFGTLSILLGSLFLCHNVPIYIPSVLFYVCVSFSAISWTNSLSYVSMQADRSVQGKVLGINQSFSALGGIFGPTLGGCIALISSNYVYLFTSLLVLAALGILIFSQKETSIENNDLI